MISFFPLEILAAMSMPKKACKLYAKSIVRIHLIRFGDWFDYDEKIYLFSNWNIKSQFSHLLFHVQRPIVLHYLPFFPLRMLIVSSRKQMIMFKNKFALMKVTVVYKKISVSKTMRCCFCCCNTSTSFEPLSMTFLRFYVCLNNRRLIRCTYAVAVCVLKHVSIYTLPLRVCASERHERNVYFSLIERRLVG